MPKTSCSLVKESHDKENRFGKHVVVQASASHNVRGDLADSLAKKRDYRNLQPDAKENNGDKTHPTVQYVKEERNYESKRPFTRLYNLNF